MRPPEYRLLRPLAAAAAGFILGVYHLLVIFWSSAGTGHGHGAEAWMMSPIFFSYCSTAAILAPFQYSIYALIAFRRYRRIGILLVIVHYAVAFALITLYYGQGRIGERVSDWQYWLPNAIIDYWLFLLLNIFYIKRILGGGPRG